MRLLFIIKVLTDTFSKMPRGSSVSELSLRYSVSIMTFLKVPGCRDLIELNTTYISDRFRLLKVPVLTSVSSFWTKSKYRKSGKFPKAPGLISFKLTSFSCSNSKLCISWIDCSYKTGTSPVALTDSFSPLGMTFFKLSAVTSFASFLLLIVYLIVTFLKVISWASLILIRKITRSSWSGKEHILNTELVFRMSSVLINWDQDSDSDPSKVNCNKHIQHSLTTS